MSPPLPKDIRVKYFESDKGILERTEFFVLQRWKDRVKKGVNPFYFQIDAAKISNDKWAETEGTYGMLYFLFGIVYCN